MRINRLPVCMLFGDIAVSGMLCATLIIGASSSTNSAVAQLQLACCLRRRAVRTGVFADAAGCQPDRFLAGLLWREPREAIPFILCRMLPLPFPV